MNPSTNHRLAAIARLLAQSWDARRRRIAHDPAQAADARRMLDRRTRLMAMADRWEWERN